MGMKYVAAYLLSALSKDEPSESDVKKILEASGGEVDADLIKKLVDGVKGTSKPIHELIAGNLENLKGLGGGGGGGGGGAAGGAAAGGGGAAPAEEKAAVVEVEEEEEMDFDLFG